MRKIYILILTALLLANVSYAQNYNMSNTPITTCSGNYYDDGGKPGTFGFGGYYNSNNYTQTFTPAAGNKIRFAFSTFDLGSFFGFAPDILYIYDGNSTSAPLIGAYTEENSPGTITSTAADGSLTFRMVVDAGSFFNQGWAASISCVPAAAPTISGFTPDRTCSGVAETITINGANLLGVTAANVKIGGVPVASIVSNTANQIVAIVGAGNTGPVSVTLNSTTVTTATNFTFNPAPGAISISGGGTFCSASATITATGGNGGTIYFQGTTNNGTSTATPSNSATVNASGTYYFRSQSALGCWGPQQSVVVTLTSSNTPVVVTGGGTFCTSATITATGGGSGSTIYFQRLVQGGTQTNQGGASVSVTTSGRYYFRAFNAACGGWGAEGYVDVVIVPVPTAVTVSGGGVICNTMTLNATGGGSGTTIYYQGQVSNGTDMTLGGASQTVASPGTYYFRAWNGTCWGPQGSAVVTPNTAVTITSQPADLTVCAGQPASFSITTTGTVTSYQWRKGVANIAGANAATYTIASTVAGNAGDYNCLVTYACGTIVSDDASLAVNTASITPAAQATGLAFPTVAPTSILGTFAVSASATHYLVVRTNNGGAVPVPADGTSYAQGSTALGGTSVVEYAGTDNIFTSTGLNPGQTYCYYVFAYNINNCTATPSPLYKKPALTGCQATATNTNCPAVRQTLYWAGTGATGPLAPAGQRDRDFNNRRNWSTTATPYNYAGAAPTKCNDVVINVNDVVIGLTENTEFYSLTYTVNGNNNSAILSMNGFDLIVNGNALIDINGGNANTQILIGEYKASLPATTLDFKANVEIGTSVRNGASFLLGNQNSEIIVRGDLKLGNTFALADDGDYRPGKLIMDGAGAQQITWNNSKYNASFDNIIIGSTNNPIVKQITGTTQPDNILKNLTVNGSSTLDLGTSQWNRQTAGGTFSLNSTAKLILGTNTYVQKGATYAVVAGNNFPKGFNANNLASGSTVTYNAINTLPQIIQTATYGNLVLTNGTGSGANAVKTVAANNPNITGNLTINALTTFDLSTYNFNHAPTGGTMTMAANSYLKASGTGTSSTSNFPVNFSNYALNAASTVEYNSTNTVNQVLYAPVTYGNLVLSNLANTGSTTKSLSANITGIAGNLAVEKFTTFDLATFTANRTAAGGTMVIAGNGTLRLGGGTGGQTNSNYPLNFVTTLSPNSTVVYSGNVNQDIYGGVSYTNLNLTGTGNKKSPATLNISEDLVKTGAGIFLHNNGLVKFNGVTNQQYTSAVPYMEFHKVENANTVTDGLKISNNMGIRYKLTLGAGSKILLNSGDISIRSNKDTTASIGQIPSDAVINYASGRFTIERFINSGHLTNGDGKHGPSWQLLATPANGQTINAAWQEGLTNQVAGTAGFGTQITGARNGAGTNGFDVYTAGPGIKFFNSSTQAYEALPAAAGTNATLARPGGYMLFIRGDRSSTVASPTKTVTTLRSSGTINRNSSFVGVPANKFTTVGNPYASAIDVRTIGRTGLTNEIYVWDPSLGGSYGYGGYRTLTKLPSGDFRVAPVGAPGENYSTAIVNTLQSGQAFFVKATAGGGQVNFQESDKTDGSAMANRGGNNNDFEILEATLATTTGERTISDGVLAIFSADYSNEVDAEDGLKLSSGTNNVSLKRGTATLAVERRQLALAADTLNLALTGTSAQAYNWELKLENMNKPGRSAWLWDKFSDVKTPLDLDGITSIDFSITSAAGSAAGDRFKIIFSKVLAPLPVTITSISATRNTDRTIAVSWKVENEINIEKYTIERSADGINFAGIITTDQAGRSAYNQNDLSPLAQDNYYRIKALSIGGQLQYSSIVKVAPLKVAAAISIYPNPVQNKLMNISFVQQPTGNYQLELFNNAGQLVYKGAVKVGSANENRQIQLDAQIAAGTYQLTIRNADGKAVNQTLIIE